MGYKSSRIKQYHREGRALRTETTINNSRDYAVNKELMNLPASRKIGFKANRRLTWLAGRDNVQEAAVEGIYLAYFSEGCDISDSEVLISL